MMISKTQMEVSIYSWRIDSFAAEGSRFTLWLINDLPAQGRMIDADSQHRFEELAVGWWETLREISSHPGK